MQQRLFDQRPQYDAQADPYKKHRSAAAALAAEYGVDLERALDMILSYGSEKAARRALDQLWWLNGDAGVA